MDVAIIGGGFCGATIAKNLDKIKNINVTLFDKKPYFEYRPGLPKLLSNKDYDKKIIAKYSDFLKNTNVVSEEVVNITPEIIHTSKKDYRYDYLVISCGVKYPIFLKNKKNVFIVTELNNCKKASEKIKKSGKILIVGGGLIGVEVTSEIAATYPDKEIIMVHSKNRLIERNTKKTSKLAERFLNRKNIKIFYNEKVVENKNKTFLTNKKRKIGADIAIWCAGVKCDSSFLKNFDKNIFSERNCLKVDKNLRLKGYKNIFVGGDITDINEEKTAQNSERHAKIITKNIQKISSEKKLSDYKKFAGPLFISLGSKKGIFVFRNFSYSGLIPIFAKNFIESWFFHTIGYI